MKKVYEGKTKDGFALENGNYLLLFKDNAIMIDEIASGNMRVYKNGVIVEPVELTQLILNK